MRKRILTKIILENVVNAGESASSNLKCKMCHQEFGEYITEALGRNRYMYQGLTRDGRGKEKKVMDRRRDCIIHDTLNQHEDVVIEIKMPVCSIQKNMPNLLSSDSNLLYFHNKGKNTIRFILIPDVAPAFSGGKVKKDVNLGKYALEKCAEFIRNSKYHGIIFLCIYKLDDVDYDKIETKEQYNNILKNYNGSISLVSVNTNEIPDNLIVNNIDKLIRAINEHCLYKCENDDLRRSGALEIIDNGGKDWLKKLKRYISDLEKARIDI